MNAIYEHAPTASLIFFFFIFLYVAWRAYRPSAKPQMQKDAMIPLQEDSHER